MAEPCLNTSHQDFLPLPGRAYDARPIRRPVPDRSAWASAVAIYEAAEAALDAAAERDDAAAAAYRNELPSAPPLQVELTVERSNGSKVTLPFTFGSERELRGPCLYEGTVLEGHYAKARAQLIPLWDEWHRQSAALKAKHQCDEAYKALEAAADRSSVRRRVLVETPAPGLQAVIYKLRVLWSPDYMGAPASHEKQAVVRDLARLAAEAEHAGGLAQ